MNKWGAVNTYGYKKPNTCRQQQMVEGDTTGQPPVKSHKSHTCYCVHSLDVPAIDAGGAGSVCRAPGQLQPAHSRIDWRGTYRGRSRAYTLVTAWASVSAHQHRCVWALSMLAAGVWAGRRVGRWV
jgi:hypothetical protein